MRKVLLSCLVALGGLAQSQTTLISPTVGNGGFESGTTDWTFMNFTNTNKWQVDTGANAGFSGLNSVYISNGTTSPYSHSYTTSSGGTSFFYKDVTFPAGETNINLAFKLLVQGEGASTLYDYLRVYLVPTSYTPTAGTIPSTTTYPSWTYNLKGSSWTNQQISISSAQAGNGSANSTMRLLFMWRTDTSGGTQPPAALDDITLTTAPTTTPPQCTTITTPTASATGVSVTPTITWAAASGAASGYRLNVGTTVGGSDVINNLDVGSVLTYTLPAASSLMYNTQYYATVIPYNNIGNSTGCTSSTFKTLTTVPCPTVSLPAAAATGVSLTPTLTWAPVNSATSYKITMGTTAGGSDVMNAVDVGNVTSYTLPNPLLAGTKYYYKISTTATNGTSASCTERNFTTFCTGVLNAPFLENFNTGALPTCWDNTSSNATSGGLWLFAGTQDYGTTNNGQASGTFAWVDASTPYTGVHDVTLTSPFINTSALTLPMVKFRWYKNHLSGATGTTQPNYDNNKLTVQVKKQTDATWTTVFEDATNELGWRTEKITLPATFAGSTLQVRFVVDKDVAGNGYFYDNLLLDDVEVVQASSCLDPITPLATNMTYNSAQLSWTAPAIVPVNGYEYYISTTNTAPTAVTPATGTSATNSVTVTLATPSTQYYYWVRSVCTSPEVSEWVSGGSFSTECQPAAIPVGTGATICPNNTATLSATSTTAGAVIKWYDAATGGAPLATGSTFTTPVLNTTTNYYASASTGTTYNVGPATLATLGSVGNLDFDYRVNFTVTNNLVLKNLDIYPYTIGQSASIDVYTAADVLVASVPVTTTVSNQTAQNVVMNVPLTAGNYYLKRTGALNMYRNGAGASYPMVYTDLSITGNTFNSSYYYYFYNWQIETGCESPRQMVTATVDSAGCLGTSEVSVKNNVKVYPNPFKDVINIVGYENYVSGVVVDASGKVVKVLDKVESTLNLSGLTSGMYILNMTSKTGDKVSVKMIKN